MVFRFDFTEKIAEISLYPVKNIPALSPFFQDIFEFFKTSYYRKRFLSSIRHN
jgi:hypothetical protein